MASAGDDGVKGDGVHPGPDVEELLRKLNLTGEEGAVLDFADDDEEEPLAPVEWALVGKILSPTSIHIDSIRQAMRPAWGNPKGLKIRSIGEKGDNLFVAEFGSARDRERVLAGTPWLFYKYAVLLQEYDEKLRATEIEFVHMEVWARILNLPLGWMNRSKGSRAMGLLGRVVRMDVDGDGKASGAYLRARVAIEVDKPIRRGVLLRMKKDAAPEWFQVQYEKLPFICFSCGMMGHSELECPTPAERNEEGKLPYDVKLRAPEEKRKRIPSFASAAAESFGSGSSSASKPLRHMNSSGGKGSVDGSQRSEGVADSEEPEIQSPLKATVRDEMDAEESRSGSVSRKLDLGGLRLIANLVARGSRRWPRQLPSPLT